MLTIGMWALEAGRWSVFGQYLRVGAVIESWIDICFVYWPNGVAGIVSDATLAVAFKIV